MIEVLVRTFDLWTGRDFQSYHRMIQTSILFYRLVEPNEHNHAKYTLIAK